MRRKSNRQPSAAGSDHVGNFRAYVEKVEKLVGAHAAQGRVVRANNSLGNVELEALQAHDLLFQRVPRDKPIDVDSLRREENGRWRSGARNTGKNIMGACQVRNIATLVCPMR